jgi:hypothetical protein
VNNVRQIVKTTEVISRVTDYSRAQLLLLWESTKDRSSVVKWLVSPPVTRENVVIPRRGEFFISSQVVCVKNIKKFVTILTAIFVHYAPKKEQVLLLTFQNRSLAALIRDVFRKFCLYSAGF